jgi:thiamine biosynthesis lipoprotein ApbE
MPKSGLDFKSLLYYNGQYATQKAPQDKLIRRKSSISPIFRCTATADALSTAFMIMGIDEIKQYCNLHPNTMAMVILEEEGEKQSQQKILRFGQWEQLLD